MSQLTPVCHAANSQFLKNIIIADSNGGFRLLAAYDSHSLHY
jgi:hypothetical protein